MHRCPHWRQHPYPQIPSLAKTHTLSTYSLIENETSFIHRCLHRKKKHTLCTYACFPAHDTHPTHICFPCAWHTHTPTHTHTIHRCLPCTRHTPYPQILSLSTTHTLSTDGACVPHMILVNCLHGVCLPPRNIGSYSTWSTCSLYQTG